MKILRYYDTVFEAEVARGRLASEGVTAIVLNENLGNVIPLTGAIQSLKPCLAVSDEDLPRAAEVLGTEIHDPGGVRRCPDCGSGEIVFTFFRNDRPVGAFARLVLVLFSIFSLHSGNIRRAYNCRKCGNWF